MYPAPVELVRAVKRRRGLVANPEKTRAWQDRSRRALALGPDERAVRDAVFARDGHTCRLRAQVGVFVTVDDARLVVEIPRCLGPLSFHHRRKASASGAYVEANGAALCVGHNRFVEDEPEVAVAVDPFLVVREGDPEWESLGRRSQRHQL